MAWPELRLTDDLPRTADVVVIGGGIVGAATAFFARRAGLTVVLLEKRPALCTLTTPASTGAFRLQFDNPEEIALVREGIQLFENFAEIASLPGYDLRLKQQGYLFCATSEAGVEHQRHFVEALHGWGVTDVELLSGDEARYRFNYLSPDIVQARFRNADGWLDPKRLTFGYARASGATLCLNTPATGFVRRGDRVTGVQTPRGTIACEHAVIATGPFAAPVAALAGLKLDLRPTIRHKLVIPELPVMPADGPMTIHEETAAHWRPSLAGCSGCSPIRPPLPANRSRTCRPAPTLLFACSTRARRRAWRGSVLSGSRSGTTAACTGSCRRASTRTPPTTAHSSGRVTYLGWYSTWATAATASWPAPEAREWSWTPCWGACQPEANPFRPQREMVERAMDIL